MGLWQLEQGARLATIPHGRHLICYIRTIHNLKPADKSENSRRGNKYFSNITDADAYAPRDEVKGDIARILLYDRYVR